MNVMDMRRFVETSLNFLFSHGKCLAVSQFLVRVAYYVLADLEVRTWQVRTSSKHFRGREYAPAIGSRGLDDVTSSARLLTVLRPHVGI